MQKIEKSLTWKGGHRGRAAAKWEGNSPLLPSYTLFPFAEYCAVYTTHLEKDTYQRPLLSPAPIKKGGERLSFIHAPRIRRRKEVYCNTVHKSFALFEFLFFSRCELREKARWRTLLLRLARAPSPRWEAWTRRLTGTGTEMEVRHLIPQMFFWHKLDSVQIYLNFKALRQWTPSWPTWETPVDSRWEK